MGRDVREELLSGLDVQGMSSIDGRVENGGRVRTLRDGDRQRETLLALLGRRSLIKLKGDVRGC